MSKLFFEVKLTTGDKFHFDSIKTFEVGIVGALGNIRHCIVKGDIKSINLVRLKDIDKE